MVVTVTKSLTIEQTTNTGDLITHKLLPNDTFELTVEEGAPPHKRATVIMTREDFIHQRQHCSSLLLMDDIPKTSG